MMEETFAPVNFDNEPKKTLSKSNSFGSDKGVSLESDGKEDTLDYRINAKSAEGKTISLWHDISLVHVDEDKKETPHYNFVCEIPKFTR
jgi:hypothetical protein